MTSGTQSKVLELITALTPVASGVEQDSATSQIMRWRDYNGKSTIPRVSCA